MAELIIKKDAIRNERSKAIREYEKLSFEIHQLKHKEWEIDLVTDEVIRSRRIRDIIRQNYNLRKMVALIHRRYENEIDYKAIADELNTSEIAAKGLVKIAVQRLIEPILREMERDI